MMRRLLQFTLDLFEPEAVASPANLVSIKKIKRLAGKIPAIKAPIGLPAVESTAGFEVEPGLPAASISPRPLAPGTFRHPRATHETLLDGILVAYEFRRTKRRTIGFSVGADGLAVSAPKWVPLYEIDKSVLEKSRWILKKLQQARDRHDQVESARIDWKDGIVFPFMGEQVVVVIDSHPASEGVGAVLKTSDTEVVRLSQTEPHNDRLISAAPLTLHVGLPPCATPDQIRDAVQSWLMRQAKRIFSERLDHFSPQLGVQWRQLKLSSAGTRWGSASADGSIRLNWRLMHLKPSVIDYVVVHELSHLRVMDHSPRFWDTVRAAVPDYAKLRRHLKDEVIPRW